VVEHQISQQFVFAFVEGRDGISNIWWSDRCWRRCGVVNREDADLMPEKQAAVGAEHGPVPPFSEISI
jgi:hypothetical protein